jgi:hypothetical protein
MKFVIEARVWDTLRVDLEPQKHDSTRMRRDIDGQLQRIHGTEHDNPPDNDEKRTKAATRYIPY